MRRKKRDQDSGIIWFKLGLYFISLWILMVLLIVLKLDLSMISGEIGLNTLKECIYTNIFSLICVCIILLGLAGYLYFKNCLNNAKRLPVVIEECESVNYENLSFLATYVIPLVCFPMTTYREIVVLFIVIIIIGCIFVKTNLYYTNPVLLFIGFNVYSVKWKDKDDYKEGIVIVKGKLKVSDTIQYMNLSDNVYFVKRVK